MGFLSLVQPSNMHLSVNHTQTQSLEGNCFYFGIILLTLTYLCSTNINAMMSFITLTLRNLTSPATIRDACHIQTSRVEDVSIVSTLCSDSH